MWFFSHRKNRRSTSTRRQRPGYRPRLESLEDRCLLSGGALDPTFGTGGIVTTAVGSNSNTGANAVVVQSDGKIVAGGNSADASGNQDFTLARYNANGALDANFGTNGIVQTVVGKYGASIKGLALQSDGKIVAVGYGQVSGGGAAFAVVRYNSNGSLDTTFGGGGHSTGIVLTKMGDTGSSSNGAFSVALQADGKIDVAGDSNPTKSRGIDDFTLVRYNSNGTLDTTFGPNQNGIVITPVDSYSFARALAIQTSDQKIVVVGESQSSSVPASAVQSMAVVRYTTTGQLDSSFGTSGIETGLLPAGYDRALATGVLVLGNGEIIVAGSSRYLTSAGAHAWAVTLGRLTSAGQLDTSFGSLGYAIDTVESGATSTVGLASNGDLLAADSFANSTNAGYQVAAFLPGGSLDTTFGSNGTITTNFPAGSVDSEISMAVQPDGKIVVAGSTTPTAATNQRFTLVRFLPSGPQIGSFTASSNPVTSGSSLTLTASNINDANPSSTITQVTFYYFDNSGNKVTLGTGTTSSGGAWSVTFTVTLPAGTYTIYAQAEDNNGVFSVPDPLTLTVQ